MKTKGLHIVIQLSRADVSILIRLLLQVLFAAGLPEVQDSRSAEKSVPQLGRPCDPGTVTTVLQNELVITRPIFLLVKDSMTLPNDFAKALFDQLSFLFSISRTSR